MPIRIYALAKELKIDSKDLADLCVKAGIPGKGSALASLDDDEVVKLKAYLAGPTKKAPPPAARPLEPIPQGGPSFFPPAPGPNVKLATPAEREKAAQIAKLAEAPPDPVAPVV
ncbi:MAG: translation initiation factor IF-2 N-terminal domain-containing protein, partial [Planctomycetota bacterium]